MVDYSDIDRKLVPQAERLRQACEFAASTFSNPILSAELKEAAAHFKARLEAGEDDAEQSQYGWKQISPQVFAVQSDTLQMTEAGLLIATRQVPKKLRNGLNSWRWRKRYRDSQGKTWLEFEAMNRDGTTCRSTF